ncbi:hypothetical protein KZZ04_20450, partial [Pseudoalteromonas sp. CR1]|uniref:hypothetical protein n=1 Tax=Pseudoalteromonas sp. CR1 TaxID=2861964 RepID=UPI001C5F11F8
RADDCAAPGGRRGGSGSATCPEVAESGLPPGRGCVSIGGRAGFRHSRATTQTSQCPASLAGLPGVPVVDGDGVRAGG